jgi:hypothetical protein
MGSRDFAKGEKKKPKKNLKKGPAPISFQEPRPEVQVIPKGKKAKGSQEEA